ncbi:MAG: phytanoyl-CoA dioxygenase family protein [Alphaproteobacteria bacterium]|nr:phytanoyl-CoA dioxygenase family protein [Alphaproteobacteria bacterium]MBV8549346.1 phytanoyl-CoA dioxygenase family protein [Alphaproteobacteria bacterium]
MQQGNKILRDWDKVVRFPAGQVGADARYQAETEVRDYLARVPSLDSLARHKPHLLLPSLYRLSQSEEILKGVRDFLGTDAFFLWYSVLFVKQKQTEGYIPWHYDDYFWGLQAENGCTAWVALNDVTIENGAMEFANEEPDAASMFVQYQQQNMLVRGNNSTFEPAPDEEIKIIALKAGEYSVHSNKAWHRSGPNRSAQDRLAVAFRFVTADAQPETFRWIKRGGVPRAGRALPPAFYAEQCPPRALLPGQSWQQKKSMLIAAFLTCFGDTHRTFWQKLGDFLAMSKATRSYKLLGRLVEIMGGRGVASGANRPVKDVNSG